MSTTGVWFTAVFVMALIVAITIGMSSILRSLQADQPAEAPVVSELAVPYPEFPLLP